MKTCLSRKEIKLRILAIGDITSPAGLEHLKKNLWRAREKFKIDFCVVNGENASFITGISPEGAEELLRSGADAVTGGNHTMHNKATYTMLDECEGLLRPINFGAEAAGHGYSILDCSGYKILVINALGNVHIEPNLDSHYPFIDRVLEREEGRYDFAVLDLHAEATGEKLATAYAYDGKINIVFGTHTHVPTADYRILPEGTGYVSDLGMCGESGGVLGMEPSMIVKRMRSHLPYKFAPASGPCEADGVIFTLDTNDGRVTEIERIKI